MAQETSGTFQFLLLEGISYSSLAAITNVTTRRQDMAFHIQK